MKWVMFVLAALRSAGRVRKEFVLENLALRQQVAMFKQRQLRPPLRKFDRLFRLAMSWIWPNWPSALHVMQPATDIRWHRQGFGYCWR